MEGTSRSDGHSPPWKRESPSSAPGAPHLAQRSGGDDRPPPAHPESTPRDRWEEPPPAATAAHPKMPPLTSPSGRYPGPPPPYSYHLAANGTASRTGYVSPPDSQAPPGEDKDASRQSLPSIHEALGKEHPAIYTQPPPQSSAVPPPPISPAVAYHPPSTVSPTHRYPESGPHGYAHPSLPPSSGETDKHHPPYRQGPPEDHPAARPEPTAPQAYVATASPHAAAQSPRAMHPPHSSPTYPPASQSMAPIPPPAYRNWQPAYSYPPPPVNQFATVNAYPPQSQWRQELPDVDDARKAAKHSPTGTHHYGEAVKRHLDIFDLESSLNEMAEGCGRGLDFARHFGNRAHQQQRAGPTLASLPNLQECDDMLARHERVLQSLARIRDFVVAQQHAAAEQRTRDEAKAPESEDGADKSDRTSGGGFAGGDAKKRRGRNAPPGRCHSCNRAETPEWRRGPDGARTLCNACGLHYAKLTRKHGAKVGMASSNLRPKENGES